MNLIKRLFGGNPLPRTEFPPLTGDTGINEIRKRTLEYIESMRVKNAPYGSYKYSGSAAKPVLYASLYAALTRSLYRDVDSLTPAQKTGWAGYINLWNTISMNAKNKILRPAFSKLKKLINLSIRLISKPAIALNITDYFLNPLSLRQSDIKETDAGIKVENYSINPEAFNEYLRKTPYPQDYIDGYNNFKKDCFIEKALEHFIAEEMLKFSREDIYADVAACNSPVADIVSKKYGCKSYRIDQSYKSGINGSEIGADATDTKLPAGFCSKISLHCAYEEFENDNDIKLIPEMYRLLKPGGKAIILPLYIHHFPFIDSGPFSDLSGVKYEDGKRVWRTDCRGLRCSRKYSVETLKKRIINNLGDFKYKVYFAGNVKEANPVCYCNFVLLLEK